MTARLSKFFYERLGEQVANELVDWFNAVDATYKAELRELNELNFARFDAKVEQRFAESDAKLERRLAQFELKIEQRFAQFEQRIAQFELKVEQRLSDFRSSLSDFRASVDDKLLAQTRFMYLAWVTILLTVVGFGLR